MRQLRLSQLVPERHTTRAHKDEAPAADHVVVNGGDGAADPAAVEFRTGACLQSADHGKKPPDSIPLPQDPPEDNHHRH